MNLEQQELLKSALALVRAEQQIEAEALIFSALKNEPLNGGVHEAAGAFWLRCDKPETAKFHLDSALKLGVQGVVISLLWGEALFKVGRFEEALSSFLEAKKLDPGRPQSWFWCGRALYEIGETEESLESYQRALELSPSHPRVLYYRAVALIALGRLDEGFELYEGRRRRIGPGVSAPEWEGEPLAGKRILLFQEQGLGDTIQFVRFVRPVVELGGRVILRVTPSLQRLFHSIHGLESVVGLKAKPEVDYQCSLMGLAHRLSIGPDYIPGIAPYLRAPEHAWQVLPTPLPGRPFKVGLAWRGGATTSDGLRRNVPFADLADVFRTPGITFYSLQKRRHEDFRDLPIIDLAPNLSDMADTAAYMEQLDLVLSVDTSVAHLAGALGVELCLLLSHIPAARWLREGQNCLWYPSARLIRQSSRGNWTDVIESMNGLILERATARDSQLPTGVRRQG